MSWGSGSPLSWPRLPPLEGAVLAGREEETGKEPGGTCWSESLRLS